MRHCVSLAKRHFELLFVGLPKEEEPLSLTGARDWNECMIWARMLFDWCNSSWVDDIKMQWPSSDPIWHGRALPCVVEFDHRDELVQQFVGAAAALKSVACRIEIPPNFKGEKSLFFAAVAEAVSSLHSSELSGNTGRSASTITHFEKDDDTNYHVDFVAACANLKARMFHIAPPICKLHFRIHNPSMHDTAAFCAARFKAKIEAGGIMPAVATSTSVASAFTCMDVFRVALHKRAPGSVSFPRRFMHLGHPATLFSSFGPDPPRISTISTASGDFQVHRMKFVRFTVSAGSSYRMQWSEWQTHLKTQSSMTLRQLVQWLTETVHLPLKALQYEGYNDPPLYDCLVARDDAKMNMVR
jgi:hypothetical protein